MMSVLETSRQRKGRVIYIYILLVITVVCIDVYIKTDKSKIKHDKDTN